MYFRGFEKVRIIMVSMSGDNISSKGLIILNNGAIVRVRSVRDSYFVRRSIFSAGGVEVNQVKAIRALTGSISVAILHLYFGYAH